MFACSAGWLCAALVALSLLAPVAAAAHRPAPIRRAPGAPGHKMARVPRASVLPAAPRDSAPIEPEKAALEIPDLRTPVDGAKVTVALQNTLGVCTAVVDVRTRLAVVDYDPRRIRLARLLEVCAGEGFDAHEYRVESRFPKPIKLKGG